MANAVNLDTAKRVDITCRKGDTFLLNLDTTSASGTDLDLTGYTFKMEVRTSDESTGGEADNDVILTTADDDNSSFKQITIPTKDANGNLTFQVSATNMAGVDSGLYVYDIQATVGGVVTTWLYGTFKINEDVSI
tara:strand:+ start:399 stop:803 length:405 start_codon:yes stop_codon:yes gene_type:complete